MRSMLRLASLVLVAAAGCSTEAPASPLDFEDLDDAVIVEEGKADDFYSLSASEFVVSGTSSVTLEPTFANATAAAKLARANELIAMKQIAYAYFLTAYLIPKTEEDANFGYGGFSGLAKVGDYEHSDVTSAGGLNYTFRFSQVIAGPSTLLSELPIRRRSGKTYFTLTVGTPSNDALDDLETDAQWFRRAPWSDWNPANVPSSQKADIELQIAPEVTTPDSWFDYEALFEDGVLRIDAHFGYDYHANYHLVHSRRLFNWLKNSAGFRAPVRSFDLLTNTSGPFTKSIRVAGETRTIEVRIFYPKAGANTDPNTPDGGRMLEADLRSSFQEADVVVWNGHSGPFYGFALANWKTTSEGDFSYEEVATVELPENKYQIVFADGCDTYHLGEAFKRNPAKPDGRFIDIVTTTTFSDASSGSTTQSFIEHLIETDARGSHRPATIRSMLADVSEGGSWDAMYGVHGTSDNPQLHPYADTALMCETCRGSAECGEGSLCVAGANGSRACAPACTTDAACGNGYRCAPAASRSARAIFANVCAPRAGSCR